jgi:Spx/MgsR family transcriptional regulator
MLEIYGIPNCDTVKRARAWLDQAGVSYRFHDFKKLGVSADQLRAWEQAVGWHKLLNRQGTTWRKLDPTVQAGVVDASSACALMHKHPSLIKRPVVQWPDRLSVGFDPPSFQAALGGG